MAESLTRLLEIGFDKTIDESSKSRDDLIHEANKLLGSASFVEDHVGESRHLGGKMGMALAEELELVRRAAESEFPSSVTMHVSSVVDRCVACHARLPATEPAREAALFRVPDNVKDNLTIAPKYFAAVRQFDKALDYLENAIREAGNDLELADYAGLLDDYMWIAVRSSGQIDRAGAFLEELQQTVTSPFYLVRLLSSWRNDLDKYDVLIENADGSAEDYEFAMELIDVGRHKLKVPFGRESLVVDLVAAHLLRRRLDDPQPKKNDELAEVYFQLGLIEARTIGPDVNSPQMEFLLEACIRTDPSGPRAPDALAVLEEFGMYVSREGDRNLDDYRLTIVRFDELRKLINNSNGNLKK